jgi:mycothiol synthase
MGQVTDPPKEAPRLPQDDLTDPASSTAGLPLPGATPEAIRIPKELELLAAARLLGDSGGSKGMAGRRMLTAAATHGVDLSLMWGTIDRRKSGQPSRVRQVCLAVPGSGRTAMLVLSPPADRRQGEQDHIDRLVCLHAACEGLEQRNRSGAGDVRLVQALPEPREPWSVRALEGAGFTRVGDLAYLRAPLRGAAAHRSRPTAPAPEWPPGVTIRNITGAAPGNPDRPALVAALNRSYIDTLDCPELCGMRQTEDILDSHRATGVFDPALWWLILLDGEPHGCVLLSHLPDHSCVELVYIGLSPELRGKGIGGHLLRMGIAAASNLAADHMACAVDLRNRPARRLYEHMGFREFGQRIALVKPIGGPPDE